MLDETMTRPPGDSVAENGQAPPVYDPLSLECQDDPYPVYRELLESCPVYRNDVRGFWALSRFDDVQAALRDWETFSNARGVNLENFSEITGPEMLNMDPPRHDALRSVIHHAFTPSAIKALEHLIRERASVLLRPLVERGGGDLAREFSQQLPVMVICRLLGIPDDELPDVQRMATSMLRREAGSSDIPPEALEAGVEFRSYFSRICSARKSSPRDDLITVLAHAQPDGEPLSRDELIGMCVILYSAGNTTTSSLISNGLWVLSQFPSQRAELARSTKALPGAIEELLRFESPVQYTSRVTTRPTELHGQVIPEGDRVVMILGAANRDQRRWNDPDTLDLFRPVKRNLAFGEGKHYCIGAHLARLEARVALDMILAHAPRYEVVGPVERVYFSPERGLARLDVSF